MSALAPIMDDDLEEDEPRFGYPLWLTLARSEVELVFDKEKQVFLFTATQADGRAARLVLTPFELERLAVELLLAARRRLGLAWPSVNQS